MSTHTTDETEESDHSMTQDQAADGAIREVSAETTSVDAEKQMETTDKSPSAVLTGAKLFIMMLAVVVVFILVLMDVSIVSTALPKLTSHFHSLSDIGWYGAAYQLANATLQPLTGKLYTNFKTKWTFFVFFLIFELGSVICAVSISSTMFIIGRAVAGMGASGLQNGALTIIAQSAPAEKRPTLFGIAMAFSQLGLLGGPLIGGLLTEYTSWRWCFYINLPLGACVAALLFFLRIPEVVVKPAPREVIRDLHHKLDLGGFAIFAPAAIMFLLALEFGGNQYRWGSATVIGLFCGAAVMALLWIAWLRHKKDAAMIPLPMLRKQYVWTSCLVMFALGSGMFLTSFYLPVYFQSVRGKTPAISGVYILPSILPQMLGGVVSGRALTRFGYYLPFAVASAMLTSIGYGLLTTVGPDTSTGKWVGYQILFGFGRGIGVQMPLVAVQNTLKPAQIPIAMSLVIFGQNFGGALFLSVGDTVLTNSLRKLLKQYAPNVNTEAVINAGAYSFRDVVPAASLPGVLKAYAGSVDNVFYLSTALALLYFCASWGIGWVDIRKKEPAKPADKADEASK